MYNRKTYTVEEATLKLEQYCAYQERCHQEVRQKLQHMHMIPEAIEIIIGHLIEHNFLNEQRFAKAFVSGKFTIKKWGRRRLTLELKKRDISKIAIKEALATISESTYLNTFHELAEKRFEKIRESDPYKKKKKLIDYLLYRGWESHLVYEKAYELIQ
ncbi:regulatory protein RecX [Gaetbulibacter aestuarii]|uniref:Regulatory protein RecX n=1 Tax=Gaetbulibacter aestuarii TaxID=1502358 RepID=A0ABW7MVK1_9FLAO